MQRIDIKKSDQSRVCECERSEEKTVRIPFLKMEVNEFPVKTNPARKEEGRGDAAEKPARREPAMPEHNGKR